MLYLNNVHLKIAQQDLKPLPTSVGMQHNTNHRGAETRVCRGEIKQENEVVVVMVVRLVMMIRDARRTR